MFGGIAMDTLLEDCVGKRVLLLGNEAAVRGAIEAGVAVAATYPGTPSSEIGDTLFRVAREAGIYFEFSVNEKVAMEVVGAAAVAGVRGLVFMKHVGLNVASDPFVTLGYTGVRGGMVVISADDPSVHSSQNEQDNRYYGKLANIPVLEPSNPQEFKDMVKKGFFISERFELPVLVRTTTRVNHVRGVVEFGEIQRGTRKKIVSYEKDPFRFVVVPQVAYNRHKWLLERMKRVEEFSDRCEFNRLESYSGGVGGNVLIVTSGVSYGYVKDVVRLLGVNTKVLKLGMTNPLPRKMLVEALSSADLVMVVEELEPILETEVKRIAQEEKLGCKVFGKYEGVFPRVYEYNVDVVARGVARVLGLSYRPRGGRVEHELPSRPPTLCPGCPHRATYFAVKKVFGDKAIYAMDIGCYTLGVQPPFKVADLLLCMGSSVGTACGYSKVFEGSVVAFIGDSTFFHAGLPPLVNALHNKHRFTLVILDNGTTAMTGHQPHPGLPVDGFGEKAPAVDIVSIVKGVGVGFVRVVDPYNLKETEKVFREAKSYPGVSVVVSRRLCSLLVDREKRRRGVKIVPFVVDQDRCERCFLCVKSFGCPAIQLLGDKKERFVSINSVLCDGCGVCAQVCPFKAIVRGDNIG